MYYIVGLGNPGKKFASTRHNVGWLVLDALVTQSGLPRPMQSAQYSGRVSEGCWQGHDIVTLYPDTFMNNSGSAVKKLVSAGTEGRLIVLHDDVDLPIGQVKVSFGRGGGGHNGLTSIIETIGTKDFVRVRIGIAKVGFWPWDKDVVKRPSGGGALEKFVLGSFTKPEQAILVEVVSAASNAVLLVVTQGRVAAMNEYN